MEASGSATRRRYDFSRFTFGSTEELVSFADWLLKMVGQEAAEEAACQVATRRGVGIYPEEESMALEDFRARAGEFEIPDYSRQLIGDPTLVLSFDVTTPSGLVAEFIHAGSGHQRVDISGSEGPLVERVRQRIDEDRERLVAEAAEKLNAEAAERAAAEAAAAEARRWRNRLRRAWREKRGSVTAAPAAKWAAAIVGGIIVAVASGLILVEVFGVSPP